MYVVGAVGIEPTRPQGQRLLRPPCLPIPARSHGARYRIVPTRGSGNSAPTHDQGRGRCGTRTTRPGHGAVRLAHMLMLSRDANDLVGFYTGREVSIDPLIGRHRAFLADGKPPFLPMPRHDGLLGAASPIACGVASDRRSTHGEISNPLGSMRALPTGLRRGCAAPVRTCGLGVQTRCSGGWHRGCLRLPCGPSLPE
jgi:hypothetical protein